jgi:hypothetical protein
MSEETKIDLIDTIIVIISALLIVSPFFILIMVD